MEVKALTREFVNSKTKQTLPDPDPNMTPEKVMEFYSSEYPELVNANVSGPDVLSNKIKFTFNATPGVKRVMDILQYIDGLKIPKNFRPVSYEFHCEIGAILEADEEQIDNLDQDDKHLLKSEDIHFLP